MIIQVINLHLEYSKFATILWEAHINNLIIKDVYESFNKEKFHEFIDNNLENIYEDINKNIISFTILIN